MTCQCRPRLIFPGLNGLRPSLRGAARSAQAPAQLESNRPARRESLIVIVLYTTQGRGGKIQDILESERKSRRMGNDFRRAISAREDQSSHLFSCAPHSCMGLLRVARLPLDHDASLCVARRIACARNKNEPECS